MIKTTAVLITFIIAVLLIFLFPRQTISPGDLSQGHQQLENDCLKCHSIFLGTPGEKCIVCHRPADIGRVTTTGVMIEKKAGQAKVAFHQMFSKDSCLTCHTDHSGRNAGKSVSQFSHTLLQDKNIKQCTACHQKPADNLHKQNSQECSLCHTSERWRPATFDHAQYFRFDKVHGPDCASCHQNNNYKEYTCYGCHDHTPENIRLGHEKVKIYSYQNCLLCHPSGDTEEAKRILNSIKARHASKNNLTDNEYLPAEVSGRSAHTLVKGQNISKCISCHRSPFDDLHQTGNENCTQCHSTDRWRPATLDHVRYFRFDDNHRSECRSCHRDNNYREYTCYGCHEHSPGKIEKEHRKEGISNYQDCAACHPSGNEHDIRRIREPRILKNGFSRENRGGYEGSSRGPESRFSNGYVGSPENRNGREHEEEEEEEDEGDDD